MPVQFRVDPRDGLAHIDSSMSVTEQDIFDLADALVRSGGVGRLRGVICDFRGAHVDLEPDVLERFGRRIGPCPRTQDRLRWACIHDPDQAGALEGFLDLCVQQCCDVRTFTERASAMRWLQEPTRPAGP